MKVIVIGAGASGLMAAYELTKNGAEVIMLEAENRVGGRIRTFKPPGFTFEIEAGAEFIHGNLPLTMRLMENAGLFHVRAGGKMYRASESGIETDAGNGEDWNLFYEKLSDVKHDMTLESFLNENFGADDFADIRKGVCEMAQGLDLADPAKVSILSIKDEWLSDEPDYRPQSGYQKLMEYLYGQSLANGLKLHLNQKVEKIQWQTSSVDVFSNDSVFHADAVLLTVPMPVLQEEKIKFAPPIADMTAHFHKIGFGEVIKILMEFTEAFWEKSHPDMGFLFTAGGFTFWTQRKMHKPLLTCWIGNHFAKQFENVSDENLIETVLEKLSAAFADGSLGEKYSAGAVFRYTKSSQFGGGYSWRMPESNDAITEINNGIDGTIWFAGEALDLESAAGTVESALNSGRSAARKILKL
ncbi:MAG: FAD-dependent oxidoreductase [Flavobacterium sp.]|nr:MAG: FAD-dependent oxidoreductase [Flavobacterium sp.]